MNAKLVAPGHLRGRMNRYTSQVFLDQRLDWIRMRTAERHTQAAIADALGIRPLTLNRIMVTAGIRRPPAPPKARDMHRIATRLGSMRGLFDALPPEIRHELLDEAVRSRCEIKDVIIKRLVDTAHARG